ncbi:hypothetical protein CPB83DRAFT_512874 [Crepidotus variabilis]|uniref:Uncharacterized protein n=1 Tax=Crepidotus variabilis TaxID=179855 RepID=A0A9P6EAQ7_9AGAR|nr:hypothetical protein CPB83DRAFT_512874 [Crepidotus variabilis]
MVKATSAAFASLLIVVPVLAVPIHNKDGLHSRSLADGKLDELATREAFFGPRIPRVHPHHPALQRASGHGASKRSGARKLGVRSVDEVTNELEAREPFFRPGPHPRIPSRTPFPRRPSARKPRSLTTREVEAREPRTPVQRSGKHHALGHGSPRHPKRLRVGLTSHHAEKREVNDLEDLLEREVELD